MIRNVRAQQGLDGITITWGHDDSCPEFFFELEVQPDGGTWRALGTVSYVPGQTAYSFVHESPTGSGVRYQVRAVNELGESAWAKSNRVPLVSVPNAPTDVVAS